MQLKLITAILVLAAAALLAGGCQDNGTAESATDGVRLNTDGKLPAGFPRADLKPYPGAQVTLATTTDTASTCSLESSDTVDEIMAYYSDHFTNRGFTQSESKEIGTGRMVKFDGPGGQATVTAIDQDGSTLLNLSLASGSAGDGITAEEAGITQPAAPVTLPDGFPGDIIPSYDGWQLLKATLDEKEAMVIFITADTPSAILNFYQDHYEAMGMQITEDVEVRKMRYLAFMSDEYAVGMFLQPSVSGQTQCRVTYEFDLNLTTAGKD